MKKICSNWQYVFILIKNRLTILSYHLFVISLLSDDLFHLLWRKKTFESILLALQTIQVFSIVSKFFGRSNTFNLLFSACAMNSPSFRNRFSHLVQILRNVFEHLYSNLMDTNAQNQSASQPNQWNFYWLTYDFVKCVQFTFIWQ